MGQKTSTRKFKPEECDETGVPYPSVKFKEKEFCLSDKFEQGNALYFNSFKVKAKYVKEFIKRSKDIICDVTLKTYEKVAKMEKLAGPKLT